MKGKTIKTTVMAMAAMLASGTVAAQENFPKKSLYLNENVTTFIVADENITMVDISVPDSLVAANQATDNIVRMKALRTLDDGTELGVVTVIGERNIVQYKLFYTLRGERATTEYRMQKWESDGYLNPGVDMDLETMYSYAWKVWDSRRHYYDVSNRNTKLSIRLNNIYSVGGYFFFDISLENRTNIRFDIEEIKVKLCDKKQIKSTTYQEIDIEPVLTLMKTESFKKNYRNVFVLKKLTFPDEKVLTFTFSEDPITGRTITLKVDYSDVLSADTFSPTLAR